MENHPLKNFSARSTWWLFILSLVLVCGVAYLADRGASRYTDSERMVTHTREVEWHLALLRSHLANSAVQAHAAAAAGAPAPSSGDSYLRNIETEIRQIKQLTADDADQQRKIAALEAIAESDPGLRGQFGGSSDSLVIQANSLLQQMQSQEEKLLASRKLLSLSQYRWLRTILGASLLLVLALIGFVFSALLAQLSMRETAERAVRRLSGHILVAQDAERRRLARELHDGIGQLFAGIKLELGLLRKQVAPHAAIQTLENCHDMAEQGLAETRTISYLLHPPMLDELGFRHAVQWYVDGFIKRSTIEVRVDFSEPFARMPKDLELVLFRVIQEALTNIHRHSGSGRAEISVTQRPDFVKASIRDFGRGIPAGLLRNIEETYTGAGVGLGGMRERVSEFGGRLKIESGPRGTMVLVTIPLPLQEQTVRTPQSDSQASVNATGSQTLAMLILV